MMMLTHSGLLCSSRISNLTSENLGRNSSQSTKVTLLISHYRLYRIKNNGFTFNTFTTNLSLVHKALLYDQISLNKLVKWVFQSLLLQFFSSLSIFSLTGHPDCHLQQLRGPGGTWTYLPFPFLNNSSLFTALFNCYFSNECKVSPTPMMLNLWS